jgi:acyl carrier protein
VDEVGIDSMDLATVALVLQDEYGIRIDEDDYISLTTLNRIAQYVQDKLPAHPDFRCHPHTDLPRLLRLRNP